jgi:hypothetical protein
MMPTLALVLVLEGCGSKVDVGSGHPWEIEG